MNLVLPLLLGGLTILLPLAAIVWLLRSSADTWQLLLLRSVQSGGIVAFAYSAGAWSYSSWYLREIILVSAAMVLLYRLYTVRALPWSIDRRRRPITFGGEFLAINDIIAIQAGAERNYRRYPGYTAAVPGDSI